MNEDNAVLLIVCAAVITVASWVGYYHVNETNVEGRTKRAIAEACQTEPDTDVVECARDMTLALEGKDPGE